MSIERHSAILVIDMLSDFLRGPFAGPGGEVLIDRVGEALHAARRKNLSVIFVCDAHDENDREFLVLPPHAIEGTSGARVVPELQPRTDEIIVYKKRYSGFYETQLESVLKDLDVGRLILCGLQTDCCVYHTAADGFFRDFGLVVLEDATSARTAAGHRWALEQMKRLYGAEVMTTHTCFS